VKGQIKRGVKPAPTSSLSRYLGNATFGVKSDYGLTHATSISYEHGDATDVEPPRGQP
jgi:hypothetical protein